MASTIRRDDVYGWFTKIGRATFEVSPVGRSALEQYADVLAARSVSGVAR